MIGLLRARDDAGGSAAELAEEPSWRSRDRLFGYGWGAAVVIACVGCALASARILEVVDLIVLFPLGVLVIAARFGLGPAVFTAVSGVVAFDYLFIPPTMTLAIRDGRNAVTLIVLLIVTAIVSMMTEQLRRQALQARRQAEVERLRNALLSALSHDLRSPLATLVGAGTALQGDSLDARERHDLAAVVAEEAMRLSRLVNNLLELTRLESGQVRAKRVPQAIDETIGAALVRLDQKLQGRLVRTEVPEEIPLALFDPVLIEQVLINILENAIRYTPAGTPIDIVARYESAHIVVEVSDRGPGVLAGDEKLVFQRLYRGGGATQGDGGIGLGLTICQAVVAAHEGKIWLENRKGGGAIVRFTLPAKASLGEVDEHFAESVEAS
ncbi:MAG TPA: ATP-binding protein [Polyangiaceae bacterium]|nr:ATP-binding protein [Polyangiaceae bacterium]